MQNISFLSVLLPFNATHIHHSQHILNRKTVSDDRHRQVSNYIHQKVLHFVSFILLG